MGEIYRLFVIENNDLEIYKLSEEQRQAILNGQNEIRNGLFIENEAANKEIEEWLTSNLGNAHTPSDD
ncbi:MAG: hypothetical protein WCI53_04970 [Bacteroidota bacterium]